MTKYKIWLHIEKITGEEGYEEYEDAAPFPWPIGEFDTYEEAEAKVNELADPSYPGSFAVVDRVWNGEEGISPVEAIRKDIKVDCWFIRKDGWTMGTPKEHIESASELWKDEWKEVYVLEDTGPAIRLSYEEWAAIRKNA
jgi:hypothetical protein